MATTTSPTSERPLTENERSYRLKVVDASQGPYVDYPMRVGIETYAVCNAACEFCPYPTMERKGERMDDDLLAKIVDGLGEIPSDVPFGVNPSRVNEPFLDTRMLDLLAELNRRYDNAGLILFTNGSALTAKNLERVLALKNFQLFNISFNDHRKDEYERVMQIDYDRTVKHLDRLHGAVEAGEFGVTPRISRVGDGTESDRDFEAWVRERWPSFVPMVSPRTDWMGKIQTTYLAPVPPLPCMQWFTLQILASGKDAYCCLDHNAEHGFGNARDATILEMYNHPERRRLREQMPSRATVEACKRCPLLG